MSWPKTSRLVVDCDYSTDLFDAATIRGWIGHYRTLLEAIASDMEREALRLPILTQAEEQSLHACLHGAGCSHPRTHHS